MAKVNSPAKVTEHIIEQIQKDGGLNQNTRTQMIEANIPLVGAVAKRYHPYSTDRFQTGCIGLIKAVDAYDYESGIPFSSFAWQCIDNEIKLENSYLSRNTESRVHLISMDEQIHDDDGQAISRIDRIADHDAEAVFHEMVSGNFIDQLMDEIIIPEVTIIANGIRNKSISNKWKVLELEYIKELSLESSQRKRITFSYIAEELDMSIQGVRSKHHKLMHKIRIKCINRHIR